MFSGKTPQLFKINSVALKKIKKCPWQEHHTLPKR